MASIAAACSLAAAVAVAGAEDATETTTFGKDGIASHSLGLHFEETNFSSVEARPDGGLVAQRGGRLESYLADGAPDPAAPPRQVSQYRQVFPQASGKSLVLGRESLTRVNPDGSIDTGFGDGGTIKCPSSCEAAFELPSGKILLAGVGTGGTKAPEAWVNVRMLNADGSLDKSSGSKGGFSKPISPIVPFIGLREIVPASDGGALVVGGRFLLRLRADGSPSPGFGVDGLVDAGGVLVSARSLPDGSVAAVGSASQAERGQDLAVFRYTPDGQPDPGFAPEGIRRFDFGGEEEAGAASWAADGSVVVGGSLQPPGSCYGAVDYCEELPILAAFDPEGGLAPGFGAGGVLRLTALAGPSENLYGSGVKALARRPDGSIVAAGSAAPERTTAFLAAVSPQGTLLPGFGEGGIVRVRQAVPATQQIVDFAPLADGKLLAAGTSDVGIEEQAVLIRYGADGSLDRSFGAGHGYVVVGQSIAATGFAVDASGQVLMGLYGYPHSSLLRLSAADGAPVGSFGAHGAVLLPKEVWVAGIDFARDGDALVLGTRRGSGDTQPSLVLRYRPDGELDRSFGRNGRLPLRLPAGERLEGAALVAGPKGRILVGGMIARRFAIARLLPDGRPDPRFGSDGWRFASTGSPAKSLTLQRAGSHLYLAGVAGTEGNLRVVLMRFNGNGRPDRTFGRRGRLATPISRAAQPKAIVPSRRGVLVVLNRGPQPLLHFDRDGKVRRRWPSRDQPFVDNVRATVSRGQLVLGWNGYSFVPGSKTFVGRSVFHLAKRPLGGR